jgi:Mg/Co/Ni transporter MgtE
MENNFDINTEVEKTLSNEFHSSALMNFIFDIADMYFDANETIRKSVIRILPANECKEVLGKTKKSQKKINFIAMEVMKC